ncbi:helicase with zinc finger domain 2-like [Neofelis nebulosa]|uniref:helicase with zinc finger domain 2-like n=1 Tax=Neofelis nebulosa TaxID=61452 RepID=UPI00272CA842|nr:helicase with zinc finger domain 2-like [Neofelis nebulosa]
MASPGSGPPPSSSAAAKELSLARLCAQLDLCLGCSQCTQRLNESTYLLRRVEHSRRHEILLARFKRATEKHVWRKVDRRPSFPRPARYEVCRYYSPGLGCRRHHHQCAFARSPGEARVWTFEREHDVRRLWLKRELQGSGAQGDPRSPADAIRAEYGGRFQLLCARCFQGCPPRLCPVDPQGRCPQHGACPSPAQRTRTGPVTTCALSVLCCTVSLLGVRGGRPGQLGDPLAGANPEVRTGRAPLWEHGRVDSGL